MVSEKTYSKIGGSPRFNHALRGADAYLEAMRERGYEGSEQDLGYLLKTAFRAHPAVKKAKRGKKGVRWQGLAVAAETRRAPAPG